MAQADRLKQKLKQLGLDVVAAKPEVKANKQRAAVMAPATGANTPTRYSFTLYFPRPPYYGMQFKALKERQGWNFTGLLLGMGGSTLRQLKQQSGANILVANANGHLGGAHPDPLDPSLHALITSDTLENIQAAINLIADLMSPINGHGYKPVKAVSNGSAVLQLALKSADAAPRPAAAVAAPKQGAGSIKVLKHANQMGTPGGVKVAAKAGKKRMTGLAAGRPAAITTTSSSLIEPEVVAEAPAAAVTPSSKLPLQVGSPQAHTYQLPPVQQVASSQDASQRGVPMDKAAVPPSASSDSKGTNTALSALFANLEGFSTPTAPQPSTAAAAGSKAVGGPEAAATQPLAERSRQAHVNSPVIEGPSPSLAAAAAATPKPAAATNSSAAAAAPAPSPMSLAPAPATSGPQYNLFAGPPITCGLPWQSPCFGASPNFAGSYAGAPYSGMPHQGSTISASLLGPMALQPPRSYAFDQHHLQLLTPSHPVAAGGGGYHQAPAGTMHHHQPPLLGAEGQGIARRRSSMGEQELLDMLRLLDVGHTEGA